MLLFDREKLLLHLCFVPRNHADIESRVCQLVAELKTNSVRSSCHNRVTVLMHSTILLPEILLATTPVFKKESKKTYGPPNNSDNTDHNAEVK